MRHNRIFLAALVLVAPLFLVAGLSVKRGPTTTQQYIAVGELNDGGIAANPEYFGPGLGTGTGSKNQISINRIHVPYNKTATITGFMVFATSALSAANEHCEIMVETDNDGTQNLGDELSGTSVHTGDHATNIAANDYCDEGLNQEVSALGDSCTITGLTQEVSAGGWFRTKIDASAADGVDGRTCAALASAQIQIMYSLR